MTSSLPVVIIGGGFSGAMLAARLAEQNQTSVVIDRTGDFGLGVAYSTPFEGHLLNVRSGRMTAVEGRPGDFVDWLKAHRPDLADPDDFAPRRVYGQYVRDRLATVAAAYPGRIHTVIGEAAFIESDGVVLSDGRRVTGRAVVLATGNPEPAATASDGGGRVISNPWAQGALDGIEPDDAVVIVGTGLTMVDMIQLLVARGWRGRAVALSRRGLMPRAHAERPDVPATLPVEALEGEVSTRLAAVRRLAGTGNWREVMEAYRPITARLWAGTDVACRARMVRHLRPWWDVHRHRIAARIGRALETLKAEDRLTVVAGRLGAIAQTTDGVIAHWTPRGGGSAEPLRAQWLIDCTGPAHSAATDPLTAALIATGRARMDALGLGLDLDPAGHVLHTDGSTDPALFVLGPPARAAFWETIAVPDIRKRIEDVAAALTETA